MSFVLPFVWWLVLACACAQNVSDTTLGRNSSTSQSSAIQSMTEQASLNATLMRNTTATLSISSLPHPSNTSSLDPVLGCDREWASYSRSSILAYKPISESTRTKVIVSTNTVYETTYTCSSTCGNVCYADLTTTGSSVTTSSSTKVEVSTQWTSYTGPKPSCTVPSDSCSSIWQVWSDSTSAWNTWENNMGPPESEPPWPYETPGCKWCSRTNCIIQGEGKVQIYYWPVSTTVSRDMCTDFPPEGPFNPTRNYVNTSYVPVTTSASVVLDGRTFYEGNVYLSIPAASVTDNCGSTLGKIYTDIMLTLASTDIHSARNDNLSQGGVYSINYADFNSPVPWSAYRGALHDCASGMNFGTGPWCTRSVVFQDQFHPVVVLPYSLQHLDPAWAKCIPNVDLIDPPVALRPASFLASITASPPIVTPPAQPAGSPPAVVTETGHPGPDPPRPGPDGSQPNPTDAPSQGDKGKGLPMITIGPTVLPVDVKGGAVYVPGQTIKRGGAEAVVDGTTIHIEGNQATLKSPAGVSQIPLAIGNAATNGEKVSIGNRVFAIDANGDLVAGATTLAEGDPAVTIAGSILSVGKLGFTITDPSTGEMASVAFSDLRNPRIIMVGGQSMTLDAAGNLVLPSGQTLHVGDPAVTISGTVLSVGTAGVVMVDANGNSRTLSAADSTDTGAAEGQNVHIETDSAVQEPDPGSTALPTSPKKGEAKKTKALHSSMSIGSFAIFMLLCFEI